MVNAVSVVVVRVLEEELLVDYGHVVVRGDIVCVVDHVEVVIHVQIIIVRILVIKLLPHHILHFRRHRALIHLLHHRLILLQLHDLPDRHHAKVCDRKVDLALWVSDSR